MTKKQHLFFCCTKRTRLIVFTFNGIKDSPTAGDKLSTKKLRSATSLAVPMVSVPMYDRSCIFDIRPKPKVRSFVNFAFGTPSAALIVKWSASNIIS